MKAKKFNLINALSASLDAFYEQHRHRVVGLDIMRSVAILLVVYVHGHLLLPPTMQHAYIMWNVIRIDGVSIFFVLSGFLIGGILIRTVHQSAFTGRDLLHFWIRRWFRTIPNYVLVLTGLLVLTYLQHRSVGDFNMLYGIFLQNFAWPHPHFFPEAWSLTIEEWFYLGFPFTFFGLTRWWSNKDGAFLISTVLFLSVPLLLRVYHYENGIGIDDFDRNFRKILIFRLDSIMYGVLAAFLMAKKPEIWDKSRLVLLASGILMLGLMQYNGLFGLFRYPPLNFNLESIICVCFLPYLSRLKSTSIKILDVAMIFISIISYSMYLLHLSPIILTGIPLLNRLLGRSHLPVESVYLANYAIYLVATFIGSYLLYTYFEKPTTQLRDRFKP